MNNKIYSPILKSAQEAFVYQGGGYAIHFTYPQLIDKSAIKHMQVRIVKQQDSKTIVNTSQYPDGIYYTTNFGADGVIELPFGDKITPPRAGELYKVQLRFGYCDLFKSLSEFTTWKTTAVQNGDFSEWSTVMAIKCISAPGLSFIGLESGQILNSLRPSFSALAQFAQTEEEYVDNYKFTILTSEGNVIAESGWLQHLEVDQGIDSYAFDIVLKEETRYIVKYSIISNNGYTQEISADFEVSENYFAKLQGADFAIEELDTENGAIKLSVSANEGVLLGKYVITRADETSNFLKWEDVYSWMAAGVKSFNFTDYTVKDGIGYKYALQMENTYGNRTAPVYANKEEPALIYLEHSYLVGKNGRQLKLNLNFQVSSFKHTVLASKQDTLGSRYPTILRNGIAYYAEFPISGLISVKEDDINSFAGLDSEIEPNVLSYENITTEQRFRELVEEFLNDGEPKLYRSATEGNFVVVLMNVSLTPQASLGRALYNFSATAYEVAPADFKTFRTFGIIPITEDIDVSSAEITVYDTLGETMDGPINVELMSWLNNKLKQEFANDYYDVELVAIKHIEIYAGEQNAEITVGDGKTITIPAYKRYYYPEPVEYPTTVKIKAPSKLAQLNYTYDYKLIAKDIVNVKNYGKIKVWGQVNHLITVYSEDGTYYSLAVNKEDNGVDLRVIKDATPLGPQLIQLEHAVLQDILNEESFASGGVITDDLIITKDDYEYKISKFYDITITGAPNESIGSIVLNSTGYYRLSELEPTDIATISLDLSKSFLLDYSCIVDWVQRGERA